MENAATRLNDAEYALEQAVDRYVAAEQDFWHEWRKEASADEYHRELIRVARSNKGQTSSIRVSATNLIQRIKREMALDFLGRMEREGFKVTVTPPPKT